MMLVHVWFWLRRLWPLWALLLAAGLAYRAGYLKRDAAAVAEMAALKAEWRQKQLAAEKVYRAKLAEAAAEKQRWHDFAQVQSQKLAQTHARLDEQAATIRKDIAHAINKDEQDSGACRPGLGADSLRLYRRALGY